jgi:hypothetical protein
MLLVFVFQRTYFHEGEVQFVLRVFTSIKQRLCFGFLALQVLQPHLVF